MMSISNLSCSFVHHMNTVLSHMVLTSLVTRNNFGISVYFHFATDESSSSFYSH
jgi:hypothetical protein